MAKNDSISNCSYGNRNNFRNKQKLEKANKKPQGKIFIADVWMVKNSWIGKWKNQPEHRSGQLDSLASFDWLGLDQWRGEEVKQLVLPPVSLPHNNARPNVATPPCKQKFNLTPYSSKILGIFAVLSVNWSLGYLKYACPKIWRHA